MLSTATDKTRRDWSPRLLGPQYLFHPTPSPTLKPDNLKRSDPGPQTTETLSILANELHVDNDDPMNYRTTLPLTLKTQAN